MLSALRSVANSLPVTRRQYPNPVNLTDHDFHFCRVSRGDTLYNALTRHEHYLFSRLNLKAGMRVLQVGSGRGTVAVELANFYNIKVFGVETDYAKFRQSTQLVRDNKLENRIFFIYVSNFESLKDVFPENHFDAVFSIEATKCLPSFFVAYESMRKVLRLGGQLAVYEWGWTAALNPENSEHYRLAELLQNCTHIGQRPLGGRTIAAAEAALCVSSFCNVYCEDLAVRNQGESSLPWYHFLDIAISRDDTLWTPNPMAHGRTMGGLNKSSAVVLSQAGRMKLFSPLILLVATRSS